MRWLWSGWSQRDLIAVHRLMQIKALRHSRMLFRIRKEWQCSTTKTEIILRAGLHTLES